MKKIFYSAMILSLAFATSCGTDKPDDNPTPDEPKTWETSLGKAKFATDFTWTIANDTITQIWSDAVEIINTKDTYNGGNFTDGYRIDFRSNPGRKGSLFSWRAVVEVENICPDGWRVPTRVDFRDLDIAMGGNGNSRYRQTVNGHTWVAQLGWYVGTDSRWGGAFGGYCYSDGSLIARDSRAFYWSATENNTYFGFGLYIDSDDVIAPQDRGFKNDGYTLRCVRDK
jgi:uncharacterized protein (TIGR02145 family)